METQWAADTVAVVITTIEELPKKNKKAVGPF